MDLATGFGVQGGGLEALGVECAGLSGIWSLLRGSWAVISWSYK